MKKLIIISIIALLAVINAGAQTLSSGVYYYGYTGAASDTVSTYKTTLYKYIYPEKPQMLYYQKQVKLSKVSGTVRDSIFLKARMWDTDTWTTISTNTFTGTVTDTVINYTQTTTKQIYRQYMFYLKTTSGKSKLTWIYATYKY